MKVGLLPVIILAVATFLLITFNPFASYAFDPPYLQPILNLVFITCIGVAIAAISGKSYLKDGSPNILLIGCAVLISGFTGIFAGWASTSANVNMTIYSIGIFVSSCFQLAAAHVTVNKEEINWFNKRQITLAVFYASSILSVIIVAVVAVLGLLPAFHTEYGLTLLSESVLVFAFAFSIFSTTIFIHQYLRTKSSTLYWYSLGLLILSGSIFSALFTEQFTGSLLWASRCAQYIGGFYFLIALLSLRNFDSHSLTLAGKWQEAFMTNRKQAADLFSKMLNGFTYCKIITDNTGNPTDWLFLDVNEVFARSAGLKKEDFLGKKASEILPNMKDNCSAWINRYGEVASLVKQ